MTKDRIYACEECGMLYEEEAVDYMEKNYVQCDCGNFKMELTECTLSEYYDMKDGALPEELDAIPDLLTLEDVEI